MRRDTLAIVRETLMLARAGSVTPLKRSTLQGNGIIARGVIMAGKFELKKGKTGKFSFNLKSGNGQVVFTSQTYDSKRSATAGITSVKKNSAKDGSFERKASTKGQPYFVMKASNGQVIGKSQMYANAVSMEKGIKSVMKNAPTAETSDLTVETPKAKAAPKKKAAAKAATKAPAKKAAAKKKAPAKKKAKAKAKK
jgi:uncharacterized protein YegP (UPF0339 family)